MRVENIVKRIRREYWDCVTKAKKIEFTKGKTHVYRYMNEVFCDDKTEYDSLCERYDVEDGNYWDKEKQYSLSNFFLARHNNSEKMIYDNFLSRFNNKPVLMDVGCANGENTLKIAPYCKSIDGFEYSDGLVETAIHNSENIDNVQFFHTDARKMKIDKKYNGALIQGMLMYIDNENDLFAILKNVFAHVENGGYICTRDTLNQEGKRVVYLYNIKNGYKAVYWDKEIYYEQFNKAGFTLVEEILLDEVRTRRMSFVAIGAIWQKKDEGC